MGQMIMGYGEFNWEVIQGRILWDETVKEGNSIEIDKGKEFERFCFK